MRKLHQKFNNTKVTIDGIVFDSKKESRMYVVLRQRQTDGLITDLKVHPTYEIQPRFSVTKKGIERINRPITYTPDFTFFDVAEGRIRCLDAKGFRDVVYLLKKKLFDWKFKGELYIEETL